MIKSFQTINDVNTWLEKNLYYKNVDPWDKAPPINNIIRDGYGDCKMLAGVVSELLNSIGLNSWIVTISKNQVLHMVNVYDGPNGELLLIDNARPVNRSFKDWNDILKYYKIDKIIHKHQSYKVFRQWFNAEVYPSRSKR